MSTEALLQVLGVRESFRWAALAEADEPFETIERCALDGLRLAASGLLQLREFLT